MLHFLLIIFTFLFLMSCSTNNQNQSSTPSTQTTEKSELRECPQQPRIALKSQNVEELELDETKTTKTGAITKQEMMGYQFNAEAGQKLNYQTDDELCIWVYNPEQQLVDEDELSKNGDYLIQISTIKPSQNFEIEMTLSPVPPPSFSRSDFPQSSCGDVLIETASSYPIESYPTEINYSQRNLKKVRDTYCEDAFVKLVDGSRVIQVASFGREQNAEVFSEFINQTFQSAQVGKKRIITEEMLNNAE